MSQIYPDFAFNNPIQRGEIFLSTYVSEGYLEKLRPVVVIQNDIGNKHSRSIIVTAVTSKPKKELPVNVVIDPTKYSLEVENCTIMANQIFTIDKDYLRFKKGCLDAEDLKRLDEALIASLDLKNQEGKEMNEIQKVFNYQGSQVRTVIKDGESWFVAKDVCDILEIRTSDVRTILENDEVSTFNPNVDIIDIGMERVVNPHTIGKSVTFVEAGRGGKDMLIVSEAGLYSLVLKSRKPEAKAFKRWITHDVIPQIRRTGSYSVQPMSELEILKKSVDLLLEQQKEIAAVKENLTTVNHRIDSLDAVNVEGDPQQRLVKMVQKLAYKAGITYSNAWNQFKESFNTAYRTNLTARINNYCQVNNLKKITIPAYLAEFNQLEDGIRVADKLLNL
jgi:prophage antirepressor-like protein/mRNA-degrading endonuclease toxin of MazEF toxin-antitoxin module